MEKFYFVEYREAGSNHDWEPIDDEYATFQEPEDSLGRIKDWGWGVPIEVRATLFEEEQLGKPKKGGTRYFYIGEWSGDLQESMTSGLHESLQRCVESQQAIIQDGGESGDWTGFLGFKRFASQEVVDLGKFTAQGHPV